MTPPPGVRFLDWRHLCDPNAFVRDAKGVARAKFEKGKIVQRPPAAVDSFCVHQTACVFGTSPSQIKAAGGDKLLARDRRAQRIPAHFVTFRDGTAIANAPFSWFLYHGNALNDRTLGLENEGLLNGSKNLHEVPDIQIEAIRFLLAWAQETALAEGMMISRAYAHRQSHPTKTGDPGPELWQRAVTPAAKDLGLALPITEVFGKGEKQGHPIPANWYPSGPSAPIEW